LPLYETFCAMFVPMRACLGGGFLYIKRRNLRVLFRDGFDENDERTKCCDFLMSLCCYPVVLVQHEIILWQHGYSATSLRQLQTCFKGNQ
jgi:hypothetical protein